MLAVLDSLPFDNADGGVWRQGFELNYSMSSFTSNNPLQVFIMPHSHNDPGTDHQFYFVGADNMCNNYVPCMQYGENQTVIKI